MADLPKNPKSIHTWYIYECPKCGSDTDFIDSKEVARKQFRATCMFCGTKFKVTQNTDQGTNNSKIKEILTDWGYDIADYEINRIINPNKTTQENIRAIIREHNRTEKSY